MGHEGLKSQALWLELGSQALPIPGNLLGTPGLVWGFLSRAAPFPLHPELLGG